VDAASTDSSAWLAQLTPIAYVGCQAWCRRRQRETQRASLLRGDCLVADATSIDSSGWRVGQLTPIDVLAITRIGAHINEIRCDRTRGGATGGVVLLPKASE